MATKTSERRSSPGLVHAGGWTLVELLVVIGIITILAALAFPASSRAKAYAKATTCRNHLRQMGLALQMYVHANVGRYPYSISPAETPGDDWEYTGDNERANERFWFAKLRPYYPVEWTNAAYHCPGYRGPIKGVTFGNTNRVSPCGSYGYNAFGVRLWIRECIDPVTGRRIRFPPDVAFGLGPRQNVFDNRVRAVSEAQVTVPSEMLAIGDSRFLSMAVNGWRGAGGWIMMCGASRDRELSFDPSRHGRNYNQVFCDGHVSAMNPWMLFNPTNTAPLWNTDHQPHPELWVP